MINYFAFKVLEAGAYSFSIDFDSAEFQPGFKLFTPVVSEFTGIFANSFPSGTNLLVGDHVIAVTDGVPFGDDVGEKTSDFFSCANCIPGSSIPDATPYTLSIEGPSVSVPEPAPIALLGFGLSLLGFMRRTKLKSGS